MQVGDLVTGTDELYNHWAGTQLPYGVIGEIYELGLPGALPYCVRWDGGQNSYREEDLRVVSFNVYLTQIEDEFNNPKERSNRELQAV